MEVSLLLQENAFVPSKNTIDLGNSEPTFFSVPLPRSFETAQGAARAHTLATK